MLVIILDRWLDKQIEKKILIGRRGLWKFKKEGIPKKQSYWIEEKQIFFKNII